MNGRAAGSFAGGLASRLAPTIVRLVVLLLVARQPHSADDVGKVVLASAAAYLCGTLAEMGTMTSLSLPLEYFGVARPPLRGTRRLRVGVAIGGSVLLGLLIAAGIGSRASVFLIVLPLPFLLALSYGYAGALNATGALGLEGWISTAEAGLTLAGTVVLFLAVSPAAAALLALTVAKAGGTVVRAWVLRGRAHDPAPVERVVRRQATFLASTAAIVIHGQLDLVVLGFLSSFTLIAVYGALIRTAYTTFLVAEGLTLAMYSLGGLEAEARWLRRWRSAGLLIGVALGVVFLVSAQPLLEWVLHRPIHHVGVPIALFAILIPIRFFGYVQSVDLVRGGHQAARIPVLAVAIAVLFTGAIIGGKLDSITWLTAFRLASETVATLGFLLVVQRLAGSTLLRPATRVD